MKIDEEGDTITKQPYTLKVDMSYTRQATAKRIFDRMESVGVWATRSNSLKFYTVPPIFLTTLSFKVFSFLGCVVLYCGAYRRGVYIFHTSFQRSVMCKYIVCGSDYKMSDSELRKL